MDDFNEIEKHFIDASDQKEFPFDEEAWGDLSTSLDKHDRKKRRFLIFFIFGLMGMIAAGFWYVNVNTVPNDQLNTTNIEQNVDFAVNNAEEKVIMQNSDSELIGSNKGISENLIVEKNSNIKTSSSFNSTSKSAGIDPKLPSQSNIQSSNLSNLGSQKSSNSLGNINYSNNTTDVIDLSINNTDYTRSTVTGIVSLEIPFAINYNVQKRLINGEIVIDMDEEVEKIDRWSIVLQAGPEWTTADFSELPTLGQKIGVKFGYRWSRNWSVSTGVRLSNKKLANSGEMYKMKGGWIESVVPQEVNGKCRIVEVPIMVNHHLFSRPNMDFSLSLGVTSFFVQSEWYGFEYLPSETNLMTRPPVDEITMDQSSNNHFLSVGEFAVNYSHQISRGLFVELSPYIQIPTTGIGEGQINMKSYGILAGIKFQF